MYEYMHEKLVWKHVQTRKISNNDEFIIYNSKLVKSSKQVVRRMGSLICSYEYIQMFLICVYKNFTILIILNLSTKFIYFLRKISL